MAQRRLDFKADFMAKTRPEGDCVVWAGRLERGYGSVRVGYGDQRRMARAHRVAYELHVGPVPAGMYVLHRCDNRACVKPKHLFLGTQADNMADRRAKGRYDTVARGEAHGRAKLTADQVKAIRERYVPRHRQHGARALARQFGVSHTSICDVLKGGHWRHVG